MLDGVVEHPRLAGNPLAGLAADAKTALRRHDQRQVYRQARVRDPGVWRYVRARLENREKRVRSVLCHVALRCALQHLRGARASRQMLRLRHALVPQEVRAPAARLVELPPLVERHALGIGHVGLEPRLVGAQHRGELAADLIRCGLDRTQPGEFHTVEVLRRRKVRKVQERRLRHVAAALAGQELNALLDTPVRAATALRADGGEPLLDRAGERGIIPAHGGAGVLQRRPHALRRRHIRWHDSQRVAIDPRRATRIAAILDQGALLQDRRQMPGLERERPLDGLHLLLRQAQRVQARGQVCPQCRMVRVRGGRALEQLPGLGGLAPLHHAQPLLIQHRRVSRHGLRRAREQLIGLAAATGGCRSLGRLDHLLDHPQDSGLVWGRTGVTQRFPAIFSLVRSDSSPGGLLRKPSARAAGAHGGWVIAPVPATLDKPGGRA